MDSVNHRLQLCQDVFAVTDRNWRGIGIIPGSFSLAFLGAVFVGALTNGFTLTNIPTYWVLAVKGGLILIVVAATSLQRQREASR